MIAPTTLLPSGICLDYLLTFVHLQAIMPSNVSKGKKRMQSDLAIHTLVSVKAPNARLGQRGRVVNRFVQNRTLYAVQFDDKGIGYFERPELEESATAETTTNRNNSKDFYDITELITRP